MGPLRMGQERQLAPGRGPACRTGPGRGPSGPAGRQGPGRRPRLQAPLPGGVDLHPPGRPLLQDDPGPAAPELTTGWTSPSVGSCVRFATVPPRHPRPAGPAPPRLPGRLHRQRRPHPHHRPGPARRRRRLASRHGPSCRPGGPPGPRRPGLAAAPGPVGAGPHPVRCRGHRAPHHLGGPHHHGLRPHLHHHRTAAERPRAPGLPAGARRPDPERPPLDPRERRGP